MHVTFSYRRGNGLFAVGRLRDAIASWLEGDSLPLELCTQGESVRKVQERLVSLGVAELKVDGQFGPATEEAVKAFQLDRGLPVNGIVTTSTWNELFPGEPAPT